MKDHGSHAERVDRFLELACADPILARGPPTNARRQQTALRILKCHPEIARDSIHTAVVCGDLEKKGLTAAECASRRGLDAAAELLR